MWDRIFFAICFPLPARVALPQNGLWKHGADEAAADRSQGSHSACHVSPVTCQLSHVKKNYKFFYKKKK